MAGTTLNSLRVIARAPAVLAMALVSLALATSPARADRCDDLAAQLKGQIDGIAIGRTAANSIFLTHPAAKQMRLGCASRNVKNELAATADSRKPSPAFQELVASAAAIVFTIPKPDTLKGVSRCFGRVGILRGDDIKTRYRRLDMRCARGKTDSIITIARGNDE